MPPSQSAPPKPPGRLIAAAFDYYLQRQVRRWLAGLHLARRDDPGQWNRSIPTLFVANHTNWWDGFVACLLTRRVGLTFQILMQADQLEQYPFFRRVGAVPVDRRSRQQAFRDLTAAAHALRPGAALWVFPQGRRRSPAAPLTGLERGAAHLALSGPGPVRICPVAFRYTFLGEQLPEGFILLGQSWLVTPGSTDRRTLTDRITEAMDGALGELDRLVASEDTDAFTLLIPGRLSVNKRLDRFRRLLSWRSGPFVPRNG